MESEEKTFRKLMTPLRVVSGGYTPQIVEADGACVSHVTSWGSANINPELSRYVSMDEALFRANEIVSAVNELATLRAENAAMKAQLEEANHGLAVSEKLRHKVGADCDYYQKKLAASEAKRKVLAEGLAREYCAWREHKGISIPSTLDYAIRKACEYTAATNALEGT